MDKRSLLLGLGIGIIVGALLMQLFLIGEQSSNELQNRENTINGIQTPIIQPPEVVEDIVNEDSNKSNEPETEQNITPTPVSEQQLHTEMETGELSEVEQFPSTLLLRVYSGATVSETATVLFNNNVIEDEQSFVNYTRKNGKRIRAGYFLVEQNSTNEQILTILTGQPITEEDGLELEQNKMYEFIFSP